MRKYSEVDVFSDQPYLGNPLAVVHDAQGLDDAQMQRFAKWTNLAETTFIMSPSHPEADYQVRIFSAVQEFPFAGHPTLGSASAWLAAGGQPRNKEHIIQECGAGLVKIRIADGLMAFQAPPLTKYEPADESTIREVAAALGISRDRILDAAWLVNGPEWIGIRLADAREVLELAPDPADLGTLSIGVAGPQSPGHATAFEVRAFLGGDPVWEDPVTGSLNAGLGRWLFDTGVAPENYVASQGTAVGCRGRVHISIDGDEVWVGGAVSTCVQGEVRI